MSDFDKNTNVDHIADNPWAKPTGAASWQDDYTRFRSGDITDTTYSGVDTIIGRVKTGRELDKGKY